MKLEEYQKLIELQLLTESGLQNILEANKAYQNNEINKDFNNAKMFKPITDSNKELIDRIEKKTDQSDELIKQITQSLPLYNQQIQQEPLTYDDGNENNDKEKSSQVTKEQPRKLDPMNIFVNKDEYKFIDDLINGKRVYLYTSKKDNVDTFTKIKLLDLRKLNNYSNDELSEYLTSKDVESLTKQLNGAKKYHDGLDMKIEALNKYKKAILAYINSDNFVKKDDDKTDDKTDDKPADKPDDKPADKPDDKPADKPDDKPTDKPDDKNNENKITEIEGEGIKKRRNGYKIENEKYGEKIKINMDKLFNNYYVEAWYDDHIVYQNQGDKNTVELLTKGRINKKKKYSKISQQIFNDMVTLSGMVKKRNGKNKLLGSSNIILNENDLKKRIALLRGSVIAGNDNKKIQQELASLSSQKDVVQNKSIDNLFTDLKTLTPILKTSQGDENVHNQVYNIIDYLRTNRHISRDQYHKYIKKHLM